MYNNNNLFFHLVAPMLSFVSFIFYEKFDSKYKYALFGVVPMVLYGIYYIAMILSHFDGKDSLMKYDFYGFLQGNINNIYVSLPLIFIIGYITTILLIFLNKKCAR